MEQSFRNKMEDNFRRDSIAEQTVMLYNDLRLLKESTIRAGRDLLVRNALETIANLNDVAELEKIEKFLSKEVSKDVKQSNDLSSGLDKVISSVKIKIDSLNKEEPKKKVA